MRGAPPGQTTLRVIEGGQNRRAWPGVTVEKPEMPEWLSDDARAIWGELVPVLTARGLISRADRTTFGTFCQIAAERVALREKLARLGPVQALVEEDHELEEQLLQWCARFELPPIIKRRFMVQPAGRAGPRTGGDGAPPPPRAG